MIRTEVAVCGAGASGMAAAAAAARAGDRVTLLEKADRPGKKLLATGNGRCNLMNLNPPVYFGDAGFAAEVLGEDPVSELEAFWKTVGLYLRYDAEGRGYPCTMAAATVLDVLTAELKRLSAEIRTGTEVRNLRKSGNGYLLETADGETVSADRVILACGGAAQSRLGGNQSAWPWLERFGHRMIPAEPALVPLTTDARSVSGLAGIRVKCAVRLEKDGRTLREESGELLFTEKGISGICVMQLARFLPPEGGAVCRLDLIPGLFGSREELIRELALRKERDPDGAPPELLRGLCAGKLGYAVCKQAGLPLRGERIRDLSRERLERIADALRAYTVRVTGKEGFERAQVMAGGADCRLFDPLTMESRITPGLHVCGELLNVDGDCGGFNLMFAFLSGIRAGQNGRPA